MRELFDKIKVAERTSNVLHLWWWGDLDAVTAIPNSRTSFACVQYLWAWHWHKHRDPDTWVPRCKIHPLVERATPLSRVRLHRGEVAQRKWEGEGEGSTRGGNLPSVSCRIFVMHCFKDSRICIHSPQRVSENKETLSQSSGPYHTWTTIKTVKSTDRAHVKHHPRKTLACQNHVELCAWLREFHALITHEIQDVMNPIIGLDALHQSRVKVLEWKNISSAPWSESRASLLQESLLFIRVVHASISQRLPSGMGGSRVHSLRFTINKSDHCRTRLRGQLRISFECLNGRRRYFSLRSSTSSMFQNTPFSQRSRKKNTFIDSHASAQYVREQKVDSKGRMRASRSSHLWRQSPQCQEQS